MAELVQRNLESGLAELQPMETSGLCSQTEAKQIVQKRSHYEYKLMRKPPQKSHFLSYIQYEIYLYMLFAKRKSLHKERNRDSPYGKLLYSANRIHILFNRLVRRFRADLRLWLQYADFCKRIGHHDTLSKVVAKAVRIHPTCPGLWSLGAWAALTFDNDTHAARVLLLSGLRMQPTDQHLWMELCRLEILHTYKIKKRQEMLSIDDGDVTSATPDLAVSTEEPYKAARLVYIAAIAEVPAALEFRYEFVRLLREYGDTEQLQDLVYGSMKEDFVTNHIAWRYLVSKPVFRYMDTQSVDWNVALDQCESEVGDIFEEAIALNRHSSEVWGEYVNWRIQLVSVGSLMMRESRVTSLLSLINRVIEAGVANESIHTSYLKFLRDEGLSKEFDSLLTKLLPGLLAMPSLLQEIGSSLTEEVRVSLSNQLVDSTKNYRCLDVHLTETWNVLLDVLLTPTMSPVQANALIEVLSRMCLTAQDCTIGDLLLKLLTWSSANESVEEFRAKYHRLILASTKTWPAHVYLFCSQYETERDLPNKRNIDLILEKMVACHGRTSVDVWLEFIRVKRLGRDFSGAGEGHWKAMKNLRADLVEEFVNRFTSQAL